MPDFNECSSYVQHLLAEHRRLHKMVMAARDAVLHADKGNEAEWSRRVLLTLRQVREELARHFNEEEQGGCMEEAVSYRPHLSAELGRIKAEHSTLLMQLDQLLTRETDYELTPERRKELEDNFANFCRDLHAHEVAENELLRQGFGEDIDGYEIDPSQ